MNVYLVGGAVRDQLLGRPVHEKDWVVVGATEADMRKQGFKQVGKDFPVFLHPETGEEYALARTERKTGRGYAGFAFDTSEQVTLEDDLRRRDLTINAIAQTASGTLVDPYHGQHDLAQKILRHVSHAFVEDPVRILRVARFAARYADLGFQIAPETMALMKQMVLAGEIDALISERVWKELERALAEKNPDLFFAVLAECGALPILFPQLDLSAAGIPALVRAVSLTQNTEVRFAALLHPMSAAQLQSLLTRYRVPNDYAALAKFIVAHRAEYEAADQLNATQLFAFLQSADAFRREDRFRKILFTYRACVLPAKDQLFLDAFAAAKAIEPNAYTTLFKGKELGDKLKMARIGAIAELLNRPLRD